MNIDQYFSRITSILLICILLFSFYNTTAQSKKNKKMQKKILFVVTSHSKKGNTGKPTGYYLSEVAHPWEILTNAGYEIDFISPQGGNPPEDPDGFDLTDAASKKFWEDEKYKTKIDNTMKASDVKAEDYVAIYYAGGHGAMWDFPDNIEIANIASKIYENNGVVGAVCHGPAGLLNIKLKDGKYLIEGKKINGFTNEEEVAVGLEKVVPFMLETKLTERGGIFEKSGIQQMHVVVDSRLITGQNPASAKAVGEAMVKELEK
jgi:putative intracellular protease/amidase